MDLRSGHSYTPEKTRTFETSCAMYLKRGFMSSDRAGKIFDGPLKLKVEFFLQRPTSPSCSPKKRPYPCVKPDLDNYLKAILDAGNKIIWKDDGLICDLIVSKRYGTPPRIVVEVSELELNVLNDVRG